MDNRNINNFGAYEKSLKLFDFVVEDCNRWMKDFESKRLVSQQLASADSICANIEEGYGRLSKKEYIQFLVYSRGSAQETRGRYKRLRHWIPDDIIENRLVLTTEIITILASSIKTLKG